MKKLTDRMIRSMPLMKRQQYYEQEKQELFYQIRDLSPEEVQQRHIALAKKWHI